MIVTLQYKISTHSNINKCKYIETKVDDTEAMII